MKKALLPLFIAFFLPIILIGQGQLNINLFEVFQLTDLFEKGDYKENIHLKLLTKEDTSIFFKEFNYLMVNYENDSASLFIPKASFFSTEFCSDNQRKCFLEFNLEGKTYNHEIIVANNGSQREFFLVQSAFKRLHINKKSVIQPIKISDNKIIYITLLKRNKMANHYLLVEYDIASSSEKIISRLSTVSTSSINFFKLKGSKILYGGLTLDGGHWYDEIVFRKI